jgi:thymidylate synthase
MALITSLALLIIAIMVIIICDIKYSEGNAIKADKYYKINLRKILFEGQFDENPRPKYKDGVLAFSKFVTQVWEEYDINAGEFPIPTLRNTAIKTGIKEILWIYQKQTSSLEIAREMGIKWWDEWDIGDGTIGQRYGATIKKWDLMNKLLDGLKKDPFSRRHIIDMYQYDDLEETAGLHPCAYKTTWSVRKNDGEYYLDLTLDQRSNDYLMAGYINKIQYVALQMMVAGHLGWKPGKFCHVVQNLHIYDRHLDAAKEVLGKKPLLIQPKIVLKENKNFYDYTIDDFIIEGVEGIKKIKSELEIAV